MTLDIIIPQYLETEETIKKLLDSIENQLDKEHYSFNVIVINDGSKVWLSKDFLVNYSFNLKYIKRPHLGVAATRQYGVDISTADFILFCDADDYLYNTAALYHIFNSMKQPADVIISPILYASDLNGITGFEDGRVVEGTIHGKIYNRMFLKNHDIKWDAELSLNEDLYYNLCIHYHNPLLFALSQGFYYWEFNINGTVATNNYITTNFTENFKFYEKIMTLFLNYNDLDTVKRYLCFIAQFIHKSLNLTIAVDSQKQVIETFKIFINKYKKYYLEMQLEDRYTNIKQKVSNFRDFPDITNEEAKEIDNWVLSLIEAD